MPLICFSLNCSKEAFPHHSTTTLFKVSSGFHHANFSGWFAFSCLTSCSIDTVDQSLFLVKLSSPASASLISFAGSSFST